MRLPIIPTLIVALAVAIMIGLGIWQLGRADEKEARIAQYSEVTDAPAIDWPLSPDPDNPPLYRKSGFQCLEIMDWRQTSGRNVNDAPGLVHVATCRIANASNVRAQFVAGWSKAPLTPQWSGGDVSGMIAPDGGAIIRLVADKAIAGLQDVAPPSPKDLPNNHLAYAVQWFLFAAIAGIIYVLAVRGRARRGLRKAA
jgi:surfeit locus 1 family protein